jgi:hypothetical protein
VLENEGTHGVRVTFGANCELSGSGPYLVPYLGAVRIVAVAALNQAYIHPMPEGPSELGFLRSVTAITQFRLRFR